MAEINPSRKAYLAAAVLLAAVLFFISGAFIASFIFRSGSAAPLTPEKIVERAWQRARELGSYKFTTSLEAAITPEGQPVHTNSARHERLYMEGQVDLPRRKLDMTLWEKGGIAFNTRQAIQMRVEDGKTYGRVGSGEWQEMEGASDTFAPGQDPMAYLAGARDFYLAGKSCLPGIPGILQTCCSRRVLMFIGFYQNVCHTNTDITRSANVPVGEVMCSSDRRPSQDWGFPSFQWTVALPGL